MYNLVTNRGDVYAELCEMIRCFIPDVNASAPEINFTYVIHANRISAYVHIAEKKYKFTYENEPNENRTVYARFDIYVCKTALYKALSDYFGVKLPWGSLTGIRPTRLASRLISSGTPHEKVADKLAENYFVSPSKAALTSQIVQIQKRFTEERMSLVSSSSGKACGLVNLYVHIPFCPSRCAYCSFITEGIEKKTWLLAPYAEALVTEINRTKELIYKLNKRVFSVYIGGGTPTVLPPELLEKVVKAAFVDGVEYTCEAGRPDTIDDEKLHVLESCGVNRISINPQTLHDRTLALIGRAHTCEEFFSAYKLAERYGFIKNVDIIAGLEGETPADFKYTLDGITALSPENITVHTLCTKRGSRDAQSEIRRNAYTEEMVNYSVASLGEKGYLPYYLYRQKQMSANLENIGWSKPDRLCVNNITVMEELLPVYACGAGAIGKIIADNGKIRRIANPKDVFTYLREFDERISKKELFYEINL